MRILRDLLRTLIAIICWLLFMFAYMLVNDGGRTPAEDVFVPNLILLIVGIGTLLFFAWRWNR